MWCSRDSAQVIRRSPLIGEGEIGYGVYLLLFEEALYCTLPRLQYRFWTRDSTTYLLDRRTAMPAIMAFKLFSELPQPTHCRSAGECVRTIDARASDRLVRTRQHWHIQ